MGMSISGSSNAGPEGKKVISQPGNVSSATNPCTGSFADPAVAFPERVYTPYLESKTPYEVGKGWSSFYAISPTGPTKTKDECAITDCKLYGPNCELPLDNPYIKIGDKAPFQITAARNDRAGYDVEFCLSCWSAGYTKADNKLG
jgi:hypothetical protein